MASNCGICSHFLSKLWGMSDLWILTLQQHPSHWTKDELLEDSDNRLTVLVAINQFLSLTLSTRRVTSVKRRPFVTSYPRWMIPVDFTCL